MDHDTQKGIFGGGKIFSNIGKAFDLYGNSVTLTIDNQDSSKSTIGTVLTVCTLIACFGLSWQSFDQVFSETGTSIKKYGKSGGTVFNVNASSLFLALTTYYTKDNSTYVMSDAYNDWGKLEAMNQFIGECRQCARQEFNMEKCGQTFDPNRMEEMTTMRAINITSIFSYSSYCLPGDFKTPLLDEDNLSRTLSSFSIRIPDNFVDKKNYTYGVDSYHSPVYEDDLAYSYTKNQNFRLLILFKNIIFDDQKNVSSATDFSYSFLSLQFRNPITGVPLSYDIFVQQYKVKIKKQFLLFFSQESEYSEYFSVKDVVLNDLKSNDLERKYVRFNFRLHPVITIVKIESELFTDTLAIFGSYWCMFTLLGRMVAQLWGGYFYKADLYNTVFRFHDVDENYKPEEDPDNPLLNPKDPSDPSKPIFPPDTPPKSMSQQLKRFNSIQMKKTTKQLNLGVIEGDNPEERRKNYIENYLKALQLPAKEGESKFKPKEHVTETPKNLKILLMNEDEELPIPKTYKTDKVNPSSIDFPIASKEHFEEKDLSLSVKISNKDEGENSNLIIERIGNGEDSISNNNLDSSSSHSGDAENVLENISFRKEIPKPVGGGGSDDGNNSSNHSDNNRKKEGIHRKESSIDDEANQYQDVTAKSFTENELEDMRLYLFKKKHPVGPGQEIVFEDIQDNPVKKGYKKVLISPYVLMFECCLKSCGDEKYKNYYKMIKNCDRIIKANLSIHYLIKKHFEVLSIKSLLMAKYPFKCGFDSIDVNNPLPNQSIMDEYEHEYQQLVVRDIPKEELEKKEENVEGTANNVETKDNLIESNEKKDERTETLKTQEVVNVNSILVKKFKEGSDIELGILSPEGEKKRTVKINEDVEVKTKDGYQVQNLGKPREESIKILPKLPDQSNQIQVSGSENLISKNMLKMKYINEEDSDTLKK